VAIDLSDEVIRGALVTHQGEIVHEGAKTASAAETGARHTGESA